MTESWRLVSGDQLFKDKFSEAIMLYNVFNALIFKIYPDVTLLEFRKMQYFFTMFSLLIFSVALYKFDKQYWFQPLIFSLFALTGLWPWGIVPNLDYHTYSHLFLVLHLSFLLMGLYQKNIVTKRLLLVASGLSIWGASFCLLHTSILILSPIILCIIYKKSNLKLFSFTFIDLCFVLFPFFLSWMIFVSIYKEAYILSVISSIKLILSSPAYKASELKSFIKYEWLLTLRFVIFTLIYMVLSFFVLKRMRLYLSIICLTILSLSMLLVIDKFSPSGNINFTIPTWYSSLLISFLIIFWLITIKRYFVTHRYSADEEFSIVLLIPCTILSLIMSIFSASGPLNIMLSSIPITAAITLYILYQTNLKREPYLIKVLCLALFFLPFYTTTAWYNINLSFQDLPPKYADWEIEDGFGKGIKTSYVHYGLYNWIRGNTEMYTNRNDYIIPYIDAEMIYMIAKRRPSFDKSWISFTLNYPNDLYEGEIRKMKERGRSPKMAFMLNLYTSKVITEINPVTKYILENMVLLNEFKMNDQIIARCFIDRKMAVNSP